MTATPLLLSSLVSTAIYARAIPASRDYVQALKISASCTTDSAQRAILTRKALDLQFKTERLIDAGLAREEGQEDWTAGMSTQNRCLGVACFLADWFGTTLTRAQYPRVWRWH